MASQSRHERQLMRQRGAGRAVGSTDFGLDFGNAFLAPVRSSRSRSRTPAHQLNSNQKASRASIRRSREPSHPQSRGSASNSVARRSSATRASVATENVVDDVLRSAKRRKTVDDRSLEGITNVTNTDTAARATGSARISKGAVQTPIAGIAKANGSSTKTTKSTKRRKRKSIGQGSLFKKRKVSAGSAPTPEPAPIEEGEESEAELRGADDSAEDNEAYEDGDDEQDDEEMDENVTTLSQRTVTNERTPARASTQPKKKRKKRKSIGQQTVRKKPAKPAEVKGRRRVPEQRVGSATVVDEPATEQQQSSDAESEPPRKGRKGRSGIGTRSSPIPSTGRGDTSEDEDYEDESGENTPEPQLAASQSKKAKAPASKRAVDPRASNDKQRPRSKASFPIVTHRLTGFDTLPTIDELGESEPDSEEERAHEAELRATLDRPHPNAVDVLGQYCRETVQAAIDRLDDGTAGNRSERKRRQAALEAVGRELDDQLVDMSAAVENRIQLTRRTRKAKRTKADLQSRWLELRRQREEVALKCDEIRQQNWQREQDREQKWAISEAAHKLTLAAERADPDEEHPEDLEFLLRTVAEDVSDLSGGGFLKRIQSFNGQLERLAEVLEGRHV